MVNGPAGVHANHGAQAEWFTSRGPVRPVVDQVAVVFKHRVSAAPFVAFFREVRRNVAPDLNRGRCPDELETSLRPPQVGLSILLRFMPRRVGRSVGGGLRGWSLV